MQGTVRSFTPGASAAPSPAATSITVTLGTTATITQTVKATSAAAVVGKCATAIGTANSTGAIAARSIAISAPTASGCTRAGFGGRGVRWRVRRFWWRVRRFWHGYHQWLDVDAARRAGSSPRWPWWPPSWWRAVR